MQTPEYYNTDNFECIDLIDTIDAGFNIGNVVKYIYRAGEKGLSGPDLQKALDYIEFEKRNTHKSSKKADMKKASEMVENSLFSHEHKSIFYDLIAYQTVYPDSRKCKTNLLECIEDEIKRMMKDVSDELFYIQIASTEYEDIIYAKNEDEAFEKFQKTLEASGEWDDTWDMASVSRYA